MVDVDNMCKRPGCCGTGTSDPAKVHSHDMNWEANMEVVTPSRRRMRKGMKKQETEAALDSLLMRHSPYGIEPCSSTSLRG